MPRITIEGFKDGLMAFPGVVILTLRARVEPQMLKTLNPYVGRVYKVVTANGTIGADYQAAVNRARAVKGWETDFVAGPHPWGEYLNKAFIYHADKDRWYVRFIEKSRKERWFLDGRLVDKDLLSPWLRERRDEDVTYRNFAVDHLLFIRWRGQKYTIADGARVQG